MKISRVLASSALVVGIITTSAFAAGVNNPGTATQPQKTTIQSNSKGNNAIPGRPGGFERGRFNPLDSLVKANTLTQAQADAIQKAIFSVKPEDTEKKVLDSLVTSGTITQADEDAILKAMPQMGGKHGPQGDH
ncbi:MAG TPA: hypothetical protein VF941_09255, partial [Clostridia bacterium]